MMLLTSKKLEEVKSLPYIKSVELQQTNHEADTRIFASSKYAPWNGDNFGQRLRSEEHTSELQSRSDLVCRLLLEKKKKTNKSQLKQAQCTVEHPSCIAARHQKKA